MDELTLIKELERLLQPVQEKVRHESDKFSHDEFLHTFILGCPRSGTTALLQYLSYTNAWNYPTNLLTRFSSSLYVGMLLQKLMFDDAFGLLKSSSNVNFSSEYGRSKGAMNANEFFHFFRRYFPNNTIRYLKEEELSKVDYSTMKRDIDIICKLNNKPFLSKALMLQYNLDYFSSRLSNILYVYIRRDEVYNIQSIYKSRKSEMGSSGLWWSAKPKQYELLKNKGIFEQIAGQVLYSNYEIEKYLESIPDKNKLIIDYEEFVDDPKAVLDLIAEKYVLLGKRLEFGREVPTNNIINANVKSVDDDVWSKFIEAKSIIQKEIMMSEL